MAKRFDWTRHRTWVLEAFVLVNLSFLAGDIWLAHSVNAFARWEEWIPFGFSLAAPAVLIAARVIRTSKNNLRFCHIVIGILAVLIGLAGTLLHLESQFFKDFTIKSLVYTAPFAAPLAYSGLGFLLVMNAMVSDDKTEWSDWIVFFALGGFFGNFVLTLCDHAQNGFFVPAEWIPVAASAFAVGFLGAALLKWRDRSFLDICFWVMGAQVLIGLIGFGLHLGANLNASASSLYEQFIYGAPVFAPLLFPNLSLLAAMGLWDLRGKLSA